MSVLCVDIGNTHTHCGVLKDCRVLFKKTLETEKLADEKDGFVAFLKDEMLQTFSFDGVSFCSVVPKATNELLSILKAQKILFCQISYENAPGLGISYPNPKEIGPDRLANCLGAKVRFGAPAVIIDMGTAVTFDILSPNGYEGGIIAPGISIMTKYLHEQTALLPELDPNELLASSLEDGIGRSTRTAMQLGCVIGFSGMIDALLEKVLEQLAKEGIKNPKLLATGGCAGILPKSWSEKIHWTPYLTLQGLEEGFLKSQKISK